MYDVLRLAEVDFTHSSCLFLADLKANGNK